MQTAVTGSRGFIGGRFAELYVKDMDIIALNSENAPLSDEKRMIEMTKGSDVIVHAAFDHSYRDNITGIRNILKTCSANNIQRLVYLSSFSVYDPDIAGGLNENSEYSSYNDIYTREKQEIERIIEKEGRHIRSIVILQPTVVYGFGGGWTRYAFHALRGGNINLPEAGKRICNAVYVDDVAQAIYRSCFTEVSFEKFIISADTPVTWKEFYEGHCILLKYLGFSADCNIKASNGNEFHNNPVLNTVFGIMFRTFLGIVLSAAIVRAKQLRSGKFVVPSDMNSLSDYFKTASGGYTSEPLGITRKIHSGFFCADIEKAKRLLLYLPGFDFNTGIRALEDRILSSV